jgi:hypothetical protein
MHGYLLLLSRDLVDWSKAKKTKNDLGRFDGSKSDSLMYADQKTSA